MEIGIIKMGRKRENSHRTIHYKPTFVVRQYRPPTHSIGQIIYTVPPKWLCIRHNHIVHMYGYRNEEKYREYYFENRIFHITTLRDTLNSFYTCIALLSVAAKHASLNASV